MQCKFCKTENEENAVYCQDCGKRLDDKKECPVCHKFTNDAKYCVHCGARIDGKKVCPNCDTVYEGAFCPECGEKQPSKKDVKEQHISGAYGEAITANAGWKKILNIVATSLLLVAVIASLIFVFFIGTNVSGFDKTLSSVTWIPANIEDRGVFDYFGKVYENFDLIKDTISGTLLSAMLIPLILGTAIAAATIVAVLVLGIIALVKLIQKLIGKNDVKNAGKYAIATVFTYLCGSVAFLAIDCASISAVYSDNASATVKVSMSSVLNGATVAGIVVALVFLAAAIVCKIATMGKELIKKPMILKLCFTAGAIVFLSIALSFAAQSASVIEQTDSYLKVNVGLCALGLAVMPAGMGTTLQEMQNVILSSYSLLTIAQFVELTLLALIIATFVSKLKDLGNPDKNGKLSISIACVAMSVLYFVFSLVGISQYTVALAQGNSQHLIFTFAAPIVTLVFCAINLIAEIVFAAIKKQNSVQAVEQTTQAE